MINDDLVRFLWFSYALIMKRQVLWTRLTKSSTYTRKIQDYRQLLNGSSVEQR